MNVGKTISTAIEKTRLIVKVLGLGRSDVKNVLNVAPFGFESRVPAGYNAVYADTGDNGKKVMLGVIKDNVNINSGEVKIYSVDSNGDVSIFLYIRSTGEIQFGGSTDNLIRYSVMESEINGLKTDFNNLVTAFNQHVHPTAAVGPPSPPTPVPGVIPATDTDIDISESKIDELKTL